MLKNLALAGQNLQLRAWAFLKVPLLAWVKPRIEEISDHRVVVSIPLLRRNRNHLQSMYFGVLACGADIAGGILAFKKSFASKTPISLVFRDLKANFLRRPEGKTFFTCEDGEKIDELLERTQQSGKREHATVKVVASCPASGKTDPVAIFYLTLSVKAVSHRRRGISLPAFLDSLGTNLLAGSLKDV